MNYKYQTSDGTIKAISLLPQPDGGYTAVVGEQSYSVRIERADGGKFLLRIGDQPHLVYAVQDGNDFHIGLNGRTVALEKVVGSGRSRGKQQHAGDLAATMPGQVLEVLVAEGDAVEKGQTLVIMEAMKMEMRVKAPYNGTVTHLFCKAGETVERGQHLVEVEPAD